MLDWLGDFGGLIDGLYFLCKFLISPVASFSLQATLLSTLFRHRPSDPLKKLGSVKLNSNFRYFNAGDDKNETVLLKNIRRDFQVAKTLQKLTFYAVNLCCNRQYKKMMYKAKSRIDKELDLQKFILRQRMQATAILGLLNSRQSLYVDKMSQMVIRDSDNFDYTSSDNELSDWQRDDMIYVKRMIQSSNQTDKRLIDLFKVRQASNAGINLGFRNYKENNLEMEAQSPS